VCSKSHIALLKLSLLLHSSNSFVYTCPYLFIIFPKYLHDLPLMCNIGQFSSTPQNPAQHAPTSVIPLTVPLKPKENPSMQFKLGSKIGPQLNDSCLPTMFSNNSEISGQSSACLLQLQQYKVSHQRPTTVPFSQTKALNKLVYD